MFDGVLEENEVHGDDPWQVIVLLQELNHGALEHRHILDVLIHSVSIAVVTCSQPTPSLPGCIVIRSRLVLSTS